MKRRLIAVLLALCLFAGVLPTVFGAEPTLESSVDMNLLVEHGISLFKALEAGGKYDSVVNTTAGCVGMGIMGWINSSALQLLKWCATPSKGGDPEFCQSVLPEDLYNEVISAPVVNEDELMPKWGYWGNRLFSAEELAATKTLLGSEIGIQAQNNLARLYLTREAKHGWAAGVRTEAALLYYCSAENHYGEGSIKLFMSHVRNALGLSRTDTIDSLNQFHAGVVAAAAAGTVSTLTYRTKVYNYLVNTLHLDPGQMPEPVVPVIPFTDMPDEHHWAYDAIVWAYTANPQITNGTSATKFSPYSTVTRGEAVTFLWRAAGKPAPKNAANPFTDVSPNRFYYDAVLWAAEQGITNGTTATTFSPNDKVSLAQMITFIWRYAGKPAPDSSWYNPFTDVAQGKFYYKAVIWAYWGGILVGNECDGHSDELQPNIGCNRAYVVTYLYDLFIRTAH